MSSLSQFVGGAIKSIQRGTISIGNGVTTQTATVTSVDTTKSQLNFLGCYTADTAITALASVVLTNATTITGQRSSNTSTTVVSWELIERY
jgi:hypothetical protein